MGRKTSKKRFFFGFSDKTPGKRFAILQYSSDDAQTYRIAAQLDLRGVPIIKEANLIRKILSFGPKKLRKNGFLGFTVRTPGKRFAILLYSSDDAQTCRIVAQLDVRGVPIIKEANLIRNKLRFGPKNVEKKVFFGFSDKTPGKRFAILLYSSDDAQTHRIAAQLDLRGVPIIKKANLIRKILSFGPKSFEKTGSWGFPLELQENASQFYSIHPMTLKLAG